MTLDPELLAVLVCPECRGPLRLEGESEGLACVGCSLVYPIRDEIPLMLKEEAVPCGEWEQGRREAAASRTEPASCQ